MNFYLIYYYLMNFYYLMIIKYFMNTTTITQINLLMNDALYSSYHAISYHLSILLYYPFITNLTNNSYRYQLIYTVFKSFISKL